LYSKVLNLIVKNIKLGHPEGEGCYSIGPQLTALGQIRPIFIGQISPRAVS
jgi:hypothetical protein